MGECRAQDRSLKACICGTVRSGSKLRSIDFQNEINHLFCPTLSGDQQADLSCILSRRLFKRRCRRFTRMLRRWRKRWTRWRRRRTSDGRPSVEREGGSFVLVCAENLVHQLNAEVSKAMPLSTHIVCVNLKVEFKASDGLVSSGSGIMNISIKPIETRCSSSINEARYPIWPVMNIYIYYQDKQQPLTF